MKGVPFLSNMVHKRVRSWASGRSLSVCGNFAEYPRDTNLFPLFRTKQSLFDLNVIINVKLMFSATTVIFSVFTFCLFCFFDKVLLVLIQSEYTNLFLPKALRNYMFLYPQLYDLRFIFIIISIIYFSIMFIFSGFNFAKLLLLLL